MLPSAKRKRADKHEVADEGRGHGTMGLRVRDHMETKADIFHRKFGLSGKSTTKHLYNLSKLMAYENRIVTRTINPYQLSSYFHFNRLIQNAASMMIVMMITNVLNRAR